MYLGPLVVTTNQRSSNAVYTERKQQFLVCLNRANPYLLTSHALYHAVSTTLAWRKETICGMVRIRVGRSCHAKPNIIWPLVARLGKLTEKV